MYTSTTFIPWPFSKIFYGNKCSYLISIMTRIYPCSRYTSISTVLWERKNHVIYSIFREINSAKIFVTMISRQISSEVLIYHLYFGLVNFLLLHYLGHRNWNLVQRHPNQDHLTMMSWSDHFLSAGMWTYLIEDNWLHWERTKTYK